MVREGETKLTITLSKKAADTLEMLTESSGFGSRGRTIEEAILAIDDMARNTDEMSKFMNQLTEKQQKGREITLQEAQTSLIALIAYLVSYLSALSRFRKPTWTQPLTTAAKQS